MNSISLDNIGMLEGTDKSSLCNDYLRHYDEVLSPYRHRDINFIELGVYTGTSMKMWEKYFSRAKIIGVDINKSAEKYASERCVIEIGSQADRGFLTRLIQSYPPTVIIDDASHRADYTIFSLETLFPLMEPGGCYVVEDLYFHFGDSAEHWRGESSESPIPYFERLLSDMLSRTAARPTGRRHPLIDLVDRFTIIPGAIVLWKRNLKDDLARRIEDAKALVARTNTSANWGYLAAFIINNGGSLDEAEFAARSAVALEPSTRSYRALGRTLEVRGDVDGAIESFELALGIARHPQEKTVLSRILGSLMKRRDGAIGTNG
jgi:tetratricopeptide (TPR) repeat protein